MTTTVNEFDFALVIYGRFEIVPTALRIHESNYIGSYTMSLSQSELKLDNDYLINHYLHLSHDHMIDI